MKASEALITILNAKGRSKRSLALELGISPQALDSRLRTDIKVATLRETAAPLGYKVMLVPESSDAEGFEVTS